MALWVPAATSAVTMTDALDLAAARARLERLNADLLASTSATRTLEDWCRARAMAQPVMVVADRDNGPVRAASAEQRARLNVGPDEPIRYRHVLLRCGEHVLSEAENWYVPSRLTPAMNEALDATDISFGKVILPLRPFRRTLAIDRFWPLEEQADRAIAPLPCGQTIFSHRALVLDGGNRPLAEVRENYKAELLC